MKTKAAVCYAAGKNLEIETVDLDGPKFGEVLVEIKASGVCHTDEFTRSGGDPEGLFPVIFGHEELEEPLITPTKIGLDTAAYRSGVLTALRVRDRVLVQVRR